jgi:hypothetical protein
MSFLTTRGPLQFEVDQANRGTQSPTVQPYEGW